MASLAQLTAAYVAANNGVRPDAATLANLQSFANLTASGQTTDAVALGFILNGADKTTSLAALSYQFFTGKSPTKAGLDYLTNSATNPNDLNDAYYAKFGLENRYINFAANLGVAGEGAANFAAKYGSQSYAAFVAQVYETIVGSAYAKAAGLDPAKAIADIIARQSSILATAQSAGMITPGMSPAQIDLALKAATAGYLMGEAMKVDVGVYASAANNFMLAMVNGTAAYNVDLAATYAGQPGQGGGTGLPVAAGFSFPPPPPVEVPQPPRIMNFVLTAGPDIFIGNLFDDTFAATGADFSNGDVLNGGDGSDSLTITSASAVASAGRTVTNIETVNVTATNAINLDTTAWTGLTLLSTATTGAFGTTLTAPGTTSVVTVNATGIAAGDIAVDGGGAVTVTATGATSGSVTVGGAMAPTGAITVNRATTGAVVAGAITVTGGTSVNITQTATNAVATTQTNGAVTVNGSALTTSVTIQAPTVATASLGVAGITANSVTINDSRAGSSTDKGKITSIDVDGYTALSIADNALATLKVAHGSGDIIIDNSGGAPGAATTLALTVNGLTGGTLSDSGVYQTMNITTGAEASRLANITDIALTKLNIDGASRLTLTSTAGLFGLQTVTVSGAAGLTANLATVGAVISVSTVASTGTSVLTLDPGQTTFTGGVGVDDITFASSQVNGVILLGGGDDKLTLATGTTVFFPIDGGLGDDTLTMSASDAASLSGSADFASQVTGFEHLIITGVTNQTIDLAILGGYGDAQASGGNGLTFANIASGGTVHLTGAGTAYTIANAAFTAGANDVINLALSDNSGAGVAFASTGVTAANVETINISLADNQATPSGAFNDSIALLGATNKLINVSGNAGLTLTATSTGLTTVDASGITLGGFTFTSGALANAAAIKGSATGTNAVDFSAATGGIVTYTGGSGADDITASNGQANVIALGAGTNSLTGTTGNMTVTAGAGNDTVTLTTGNNIVNLGNGTNSFTATSGANDYTGGTGADAVTVGGGANAIDVREGVDQVTITAATEDHFAGGSFYGLDKTSGDKIVFTGLSVPDGVLGAAMSNPSGDYELGLALATASDGSATPIVSWFGLGASTFLVIDHSAASGFQDGVDYIVRLAGVLDLSNSVFSSSVLTLQ